MELLTRALLFCVFILNAVIIFFAFDTFYSCVVLAGFFHHYIPSGKIKACNKKGKSNSVKWYCSRVCVKCV